MKFSSWTKVDEKVFIWTEGEMPEEAVSQTTDVPAVVLSFSARSA